MPKPDLYAILGVPVDASSEAIKAAYRRLAMRMHPDTGRQPDPARFREVHDAYQVLNDAARRRSYDLENGRAARSFAQQINPAPIRIPGDFESVAPSLGEMLGHIARDFFGFHQTSGSPHRRLQLEIVLSLEEASLGGRLPLEVPCREPCPYCNGGLWGLCPRCHGVGLVATERAVTLEIPAGIRSGSRYKVALDRAGIANLTLDVTVLVA